MKTRLTGIIARLTVLGFWHLIPTTEAWDGCGHKTVAAIAFDQLSPKTRNSVNAIFKKDKRGRHFIDAATWPDDIKQGLHNDNQGAPGQALALRGHPL